MSTSHLAITLNDQGIAHKERGQFRQAAACYRQAAAADPTWSVPPYNLGLIYKQVRNWAKTFHYNRKAVALDTANDAAWWNLGIAATALRRWTSARHAWRGFGIEVSDGRGPIDLPCGLGPFRLNPHGGAEVVWAFRLDPARADIVSIPFPESGHRWHDVILNDGAPNGYRTYQGQEVPVLDALQILRPSRFGTYVARVAMTDPAAATALTELATQQGGNAEDWTTSVRMLCQACSEGRPHADHDRDAEPPAGTHLIGVAARSRAHAAAILRAWEEQTKYVEVQALEVGLKSRRPHTPGR